MKTILIFQHFGASNAARNEELKECILHNLKIRFDRILIWNDSVDPIFVAENVYNIQANRRMTYRDYIDIIDLQENGSLVVLTNTDIMLDTNILAISEVIRKNFFCVLLDMKGEKLRCSFLMRRGVRTMYGQ
jgi:hypothetical protein